MQGRHHPHAVPLLLLLLVVLAGVVGAAPYVASAGGSARFTGHVTWVRETGVRLDNLYLSPAGTAGWKHEIKGDQYALHPGDKIRVTSGLIQFNVQLRQGQASCETRQSRGSLTVNPSPQVLLYLRGGESLCSMTGSGTCIGVGFGAQLRPGTSAVRKCSPSPSRSQQSAMVSTTQPTLIEVVVRPKSSVVKVRRGVVTVTGIAGKKRAVVVSSNGRTAAQQVVVSNGKPTPAAPTKLSPADARTFLQLAANLPPNHDLQPPPPPRLLSHPGHLSTSRAVSFEFAPATVGTVTSCALSRSGIVVDPFHLCAGSATYPNLREGSYTFRVRATDAAGNTGKVRSYSFRVDITPPRVSIGGPPSLSASHDATFTFNASEPAKFTCSLDDADPATCSSPKTYTALKPGRHTLTVEATDTAGNLGPTSYSWTIERPASGPIAFESNRSGLPQIYVMNQDGTNQRQLTFAVVSTDSADDQSFDPDWSPDGQKLAFHRTHNGNIDIYTMSADGGNETRLTTSLAVDRNPVWSPDGKKIAFESDRDGGSREIYVMNADGTHQTRLTNSPGDDFDPDWSLDEKKIAFASERDGNREIYVMNADGTHQTRLTTTPAATEYNPEWSPDGSRIAFHSDRTQKDINYQIYVMNSDGSNPTRLTANSSKDYNPTWSPDGSRIAFQSDRDGNTEIYVMHADGSNQTRLTFDTTAVDQVPDW
jgi:Tol biopolymer transport system component